MFIDLKPSEVLRIVVYEISGTSERINKFLDDLDTIGGIKVELVRSGPIGLGI